MQSNGGGVCAFVREVFDGTVGGGLVLVCLLCLCEGRWVNVTLERVSNEQLWRFRN